MISIDLAFVFQFVNFLVLMLVLNVLLYKPVRGIMAERQAEITAANEKTVSLDKEIQEKMELYELKLRETKSRAHEEKNRVVLQAREEESGIIVQARREAAVSVSSIQKQVAREAEEARHLLREQAQTISREICEKVLGRSLHQ